MKKYIQYKGFFVLIFVFCAPKPSNSYSGTTGSAPLTSDQIQAFSEKFAAMEEEQKWEIEKGVYVENKMYEFGLACSHEQ